ncbi:carboxypeptidase M32 [Ponticoccus sp. SC2-23]|uniref:carboxypeptidase M32 n=1 Tax=Alexandriicola marinus TaxID=2081710 RepID=UPI000FDA864D|nr:carboxypeptidase M32 [Alexandriicola marinus]MBM1219790.1 carboxypeptidase M32 [Ponticoccus sp. SC6-9]MBM1223138.1 carboxypeptidase M32 [Ponticoccus sp. SC6-15]MBM1229603.1 carboxypeptidase M32 [Ponticoccus sp. SC6-38]MBM1232104.1 carboxypeptidase M32 [Ponticoccus sp. SC6-45]MBM1237946.1 carboxypeptidase M32 [Ponticoccus sp. SC6-49]MBM1241115.1 carboxypeptidase M32 [Ponticoccus sp. SC2-64]MBM1245628.1 carboxypeptidase M32 [Ponticoccus sp. SC6-42]MBM1250106.1 carboxypeptidase M32 [Pontico
MGYAALLEATGRVNDLLNAGSILSWDARTMMPKGGAETRSKQLATLAVAARNLLCSDEMKRALEAAEAEVAGKNEDSVEARITAQVREAIAYHERIPTELLRRKTELGSATHEVWAEARQKADFSMFADSLRAMVEINREMAQAIGFEDHPYDALMYRFEPGTTKAGLDTLFARLREGMLPLVRAIAQADKPRSDFLFREFPVDAQMDFALSMAQKIGYDTHRGRLDLTVHPFEISFTRNDVRITTRVASDYMPMSLFGALHEAGHAMYEQNVDPAYTRTPLATDLVGLYAVGGVSFGAHESQSRLWENHVGRSRAFWVNHMDEARAAYPGLLDDVDAEEFYRAVNRSEPSLIRVEADELTYDFHVMLRCELEAKMVDGSLDVADLPEAWNAAIKEYLGIDVPDDAKGVLQDVHWSSGQIGTFCNYTIGNIMAAQLFDHATSQDPGIEAALEKADYAPLRDWLTDNVCQHGRRFGRDELLERATGRPLDPEPYIAHLTTKFSDIYALA